MIVVTGYITINPDKRADVEAAIATLVAATRAEEGNVDYRYSADLGVADRINIVEQWESKDAMDLHMATPHMAEFLGVMGDAIGGPVEILSHDVSATTKIF